MLRWLRHAAEPARGQRAVPPEARPSAPSRDARHPGRRGRARSRPPGWRARCPSGRTTCCWPRSTTRTRPPPGPWPRSACDLDELRAKLRAAQRRRHHRRAAGAGRPPPDGHRGLRRDPHHRPHRPGDRRGGQGGPARRQRPRGRRAQAASRDNGRRSRRPRPAAATATVIRGDHPAAASLAKVWLELRKTLSTLAPAVTPVKPNGALSSDTPAAGKPGRRRPKVKVELKLADEGRRHRRGRDGRTIVAWTRRTTRLIILDPARTSGPPPRGAADARVTAPRPPSGPQRHTSRRLLRASTIQQSS